MKTPLAFAKDILTDKNQEEILPCDSFVKFLVQRYISVASMSHCSLINSTLNMKMKEWNDEQEIYNFLKCLIPKKSNVYLEYIWKKKDTHDIPIDVDVLADSMEIPKKEILDLIELFPDICEDMKDSPEKILKAK